LTSSAPPTRRCRAETASGGVASIGSLTGLTRRLPDEIAGPVGDRQRRAGDEVGRRGLGAGMGPGGGGGLRGPHDGGKGAQPLRRHLGDTDSDELADATRAELYEKAKRADIPGRSSMTKDDLAEALRAQD
jgi:hypothetical protein